MEWCASDWGAVVQVRSFCIPSSILFSRDLSRYDCMFKSEKIRQMNHHGHVPPPSRIASFFFLVYLKSLYVTFALVTGLTRFPWFPWSQRRERSEGKKPSTHTVPVSVQYYYDYDLSIYLYNRQITAHNLIKRTSICWYYTVNDNCIKNYNSFQMKPYIYYAATVCDI